MYGYIYKTTNLITRKIYIGQKKSSYFLGNKYLGSGLRLKEAINKYSIENFSTELIDTADTVEELNQKEIYWIAYYNSTIPTIGYNIANGGYWATNYHNGMLGKTQTQKQKQAVSTYMRNRVVTLETRRRMSEAAKKRPKQESKNKGKIWVYKGTTNKIISQDDLENYISLGYRRGKVPMSSKYRNEIKNKYKNGTYIYKENSTKFIPLNDLSYYEKMGYKKGRPKRPSSVGRKISKAKSGSIRITNGVSIKYIDPKKLSEYKELGYYKWSIQNSTT